MWYSAGVTLFFGMLIWCRSCHMHLVSCFCLMCVLTVLHRCASSCQDKMDPNKDDDVTLAFIIAAASSEHRHLERKQLMLRVLVRLFLTLPAMYRQLGVFH